MITDRDTLAAIINDAIRYNFPVDLMEDKRFKQLSLIWANASANAIIAAGWAPNTNADALQARFDRLRKIYDDATHRIAELERAAVRTPPSAAVSS